MSSHTGDLFKQLGLQKLSKSSKNELSEQLGQVAMDRIAARLEAILTPEQAEEFESVLQRDEDEAFALLAQFVPEYPAIVIEEVTGVQNETVAMHDSIMQRFQANKDTKA